MLFSWNAQKSKMSDIKGKEKEQERKGRLRNKEIDLEKTKYNYDLIHREKNLYQTVKGRVEDLKENGSRVQVNSVVAYSNIFTIEGSYAEKIGGDGIKKYFQTITDYFKEKFGDENVVSAKVHLDETNPHMHLHFLPVNQENGRLQARSVMTRQRMNQMHEEIPRRLRENGFEVVRGSSAHKTYIKDVHEFKVKKADADIEQLEQKKQEKEDQLKDIEKILGSRQRQIEETDEKISDKTEQLNLLTRQVEEQNRQMMQMRIAVDDFNEERRRLKEDIKEMQKEKSLIADQTEQIILDKQQAENAVKTAEKSLSRLNNDQRLARNAVRQLNEEYSELKQDYSSDRKEYEEWMNEVAPKIKEGQSVLDDIKAHGYDFITEQLMYANGYNERLLDRNTTLQNNYDHMKELMEKTIVTADQNNSLWIRDLSREYQNHHEKTPILQSYQQQNLKNRQNDRFER